MIDTPALDPEVVRLQSLVFQHRLKMIDVLTEAGVSRSTWSRMRNGDNFYVSNLRKIEAAIVQLTQKDRINGEDQN